VVVAVRGRGVTLGTGEVLSMVGGAGDAEEEAGCWSAVEIDILYSAYKRAL
jgi:hypothetical protein